MYKYLSVIAFALVFTTTAHANPCEPHSYRPSSDPHLAAGSVPNTSLDQHLNLSQYAHGIQFDIEQDGGDLRVDIIGYPAEAQLAAGLFMLLQISRLAQDDFERLVLVEEGEEIFSLDGQIARRNGCQALWGVSTAGSPLPLFVDIMGAVKDAEGHVLIPRYSGNWLSDMNIALEAFNEAIAPEWIFSAAGQ
ncbi:MAG: hypothetical protein GKR98_13025 [Boseongicola sp.]|nr:MAG: hypothetical protein GKR98_13025 [Boseongicola sp.]